MGGGTGTGASPVVARLAREAGILTVGVVTRPFGFEGEQRGRIAREGIEELQKDVDALIVISNDRLLTVTDKNTSFKQAFSMCDEVLLQAVKSIAEIIREKQAMNIDFADVRAVLQNAGSAFIGIGIASGENRSEEASLEAINSPLLDVSISGAKGVLLSIATHPDDLKIHEVNEIARIINESIDPNAKFIFGPIEDDRLKKGELKVTVIATGFDQRNNSRPISSLGQRVQTNHQSQQQHVDTVVEEAATYTASSSPVAPVMNTNTARPSSSAAFANPIAINQSAPVKSRDVSDDDMATMETIDDSDEEWSNIPAFLRRKK
jgi:cell division protein FtsZ